MQNNKPVKKLTQKERLEQQIKDRQERLKELKKKEVKEARRIDTNQKVKVGAAIISEYRGKPEKWAELLQLLDSFYTNDYDRKYFVEWGLSPHHKNAAQRPKNEAGQ